MRFEDRKEPIFDMGDLGVHKNVPNFAPPAQPAANAEPVAAATKIDPDDIDLLPKAHTAQQADAEQVADSSDEVEADDIEIDSRTKALEEEERERLRIEAEAAQQADAEQVADSSDEVEAQTQAGNTAQTQAGNTAQTQAGNTAQTQAGNTAQTQAGNTAQTANAAGAGVPYVDAVEQQAAQEALLNLVRQASAANANAGRVNGPVHQAPQGAINVNDGVQQVKSGASAFIDGALAALGGAGSLVGATLKAGGVGAATVAAAVSQKIPGVSDLSRGNADNGISMPRISDYRVNQAESAADDYMVATQKFWESGGLPNIKKEIEERAKATGLPVADVIEKMRPGGEMSDLHDKFCQAVAASPDAQEHKKSMDKSLNAWARQYERGQEELLNPETSRSPHVNALRKRLEGSHEEMEKNTSKTPMFEDEEKSNSEKLRERVEEIMERIKEIVKSLMNLFRGKKEADSEVDNAPSA